MTTDFDGKQQQQQIHDSKFHDGSGIKSYRSFDEYLQSIKNKFEPPKPITQSNSTQPKSVTQKYTW